MTASSQLPYPPFELASRVAKLPSNDFAGFVHYEVKGSETKQELMRLLPESFDLTGKRILDFGCGAGRTLRHFVGEAEADTEVWGVDIDAPSIAWMKQNLCPPLNVTVSGTAPPLPFKDDSFDLIWAVSVFTHLTDQSVPWLLELHRILEPGGLLMASYMGEWNSERLAGEPWEEDRVGMNVLRHDNPWEHGGPMVLMSDWWIEEHWGRAFEVVDRAPRVFNQTWPLLRKRPVSISAEELMAPAHGDEREIRALRHNVAQLQREVEGWREDVIALQQSQSWRLTAPLRRLRGPLRRFW